MRGGLYHKYISIFFTTEALILLDTRQKHASGSSHESQYGPRDKSSRIPVLFIKLYGVFTM